VLLWGGLGLIATGCGGSSAGQTVGTGAIERPPDPIPTTSPADVYNVTMTTTAGQFQVDKLEIEFNRRRGIHEFYGFYRDQYDTMVRIPFYKLTRVDFTGPLPQSVFDQINIGREQEYLQPNQGFILRLWFREGSQEQFIAFIPKFRGEKDLQLWEFPMDNNFLPIDYIEFDR
jgi:hypothetical protein